MRETAEKFMEKLKRIVYVEWAEYGISDEYFKNEATLNFFLNDCGDGIFDYGTVSIVPDGKRIDYDNIIYCNNPKFKDHKEYQKFVEMVAEYHNRVFLEIADIKLADKDGYGRFWCYVNDRTYVMEYEDDWNVYNDYRRVYYE